MQRGIKRRDLARLTGLAAVGLGLGSLPYTPRVYGEVIQPALEQAAAGNPPVIWLQGSGCTGCSVSLLNSTYPAVADVLLKIISLRFHPTVMAAAGDQAMAALDQTVAEDKGKFILVVEGSIPVAEGGAYGTFGEDNGRHVTILERAKELGAAAMAVVALGTCSSFGGIPAAAPNPTGAKSFAEATGIPTVNIPGCPPHPDWIVGTLAHILLLGMPELDANGRPKLFYSRAIHDNCQFYHDFEKGNYARRLGDNGCLVFLGCKGPTSFADCYERHWNGGVNWCIGSGAPCIACVEPNFPDGVSPLYSSLSDERLGRAFAPAVRTIVQGVVPNVVGQREEDARRAIDDAGLTNGPSTNYQGRRDLPDHVLRSVEIGCVLSSTPLAGTQVGAGGIVNIAVRQS